MLINISALETWLACRRLWHYTYELKRGHELSTDYFTEGKNWHALCEGVRQLEVADPYWMHEGFKQWTLWLEEHPEFVLRDKELTLKAPLGEHTILGRLDALATWMGQYFHVQYKTLRPNANVHMQSCLKQHSYHELAYRYLAEAHGYTPWGGTLLVTVRKVTQGNPLIVQPLCPESSETFKEDIAELERYCNEMYFLPRHRNRKACFGQFESRPCQYMNVCFGPDKIEDFPERDPLKDYHLKESVSDD